MDHEDEIRQLNSIIDKQKMVIDGLEKSLNESERTIRSIVSRLPLGFIVLNQELKIEAVNNRVVELFEYSTDELAQSKMDLLFPALGEITELPPNCELKALTKSKRERITILSVNCVRISNQTRYFVHIHDITEQHRLENLKRNFVSMLSHDLRSPIANLQILLTMLEDGEFGTLDGDGIKRVSSAKSSTDRLIKMIVELLDLERMEEGLFVLQKDRCSVSGIIDGAIDDAFELCESKDIAVESAVGDFHADCDARQIRRVAVNLLTNAIRFAPEGSTIEVTVIRQNDALRIGIRDSGPGIPAEKQKNIFDRFQQGESEQSAGFGLGLAICKAIVEQHGGIIDVISVPGQGCEFWFALPAGS